MNQAAQLRHFSQSQKEKRILFCGDDDLDRAAVYLAAILDEQQYAFDYIPSTLKFPDDLQLHWYRLVILSDYPRINISDHRLTLIEQFVRDGGHILMIGGWESFTGLQNEYNSTILRDVLPVEMLASDDRVNLSQGCIVLPAAAQHPITDNIDWNRPGIIGGYNRLIPKNGSAVILKGKCLSITAGKHLRVTVNEEEIPLLVEGSYRSGKAGALAFDLAPHWIGGLVDWGDQRKRIDFNDTFIEVGNFYHRLVSNLIAYFYN